MRVLKHFVLWSLGLAEAQAQTSEAERECLARHATSRRRLIEIGVWHGMTTCRLRAVMDPKGTLFGVDPYPVGRLGFSMPRLIARTEVAKVRNGSVQWIRSTGVQFACDYRASDGQPVDFVFIDGDHSYEGIQGDWGAWSRLVAPSGIVALHDSRSSETRNIEDAGSVIFTREMVLQDHRFELVEAVDTLTVLARRNGM